MSGRCWSPFREPWIGGAAREFYSLLAEHADFFFGGDSLCVVARQHSLLTTPKCAWNLFFPFFPPGLNEPGHHGELESRGAPRFRFQCRRGEAKRECGKLGAGGDVGVDGLCG